LNQIINSLCEEAKNKDNRIRQLEEAIAEIQSKIPK